MLFIKILKGINISQAQCMLLFSTGTRTNGIIWLRIHWKSGRCFLSVRREYLEQTSSGSNEHRFLWKVFVLFSQKRNKNNNMEIILRTHIMKAVHFRSVWKYSWWWKAGFDGTHFCMSCLTILLLILSSIPLVCVLIVPLRGFLY